jgi:hypothetical protein
LRLACGYICDTTHEHLAATPVALTHVVLHDRVAAGEPVLVAETLEHPLRRVPLLAMDFPIALQPAIDDPGESIQLRPLGRCAVRRYPGGTENAIILLTLSREILKCRAASRWLMPSAHASRTFRYKSTLKILPPSLSPERVKVADFCTAVLNKNRQTKIRTFDTGQIKLSRKAASLAT